MAINDFWNKFYIEKNPSINNPSSFAVFCKKFISKEDLIIDIGAGNGRDTFFFAKEQHNVISIDQSKVAIDYINSRNEKKIKAFNYSVCSDILGGKLINAIISHDDNTQSRVISFYSRFFLHAISELEQHCFFELINNFRDTHFNLFLEFRTDKDAELSKATEDHFRRFINPNDIRHIIENYNWNLVHYEEGTGLAKYKNDDAYVARMIIKNF